MELEIYSPKENEFLKEISFNHESIKAELAQRLEKYNNLVYSESNIKEAKTDRATLNKFKEAIETRRKDIKKQCLKPYEDFEAKIKEITAMIDKPILAIDTQVKAYEQIKKDEKLEGIKIFYNDRVGDLAKLVPFDRVFNQKWLNATYKGADIEKEIMDLFVKIEADLNVINELHSEYELQIKDAYLKNYDLTAALQEKTRLEEQAAKLAEHKRIQAEREAHEKERHTQDPEPVKLSTPEPPIQQVVLRSEPQKDEQLRQMDFRVWGTIEQLLDLQQYLKDKGIKYGKVGAA